MEIGQCYLKREASRLDPNSSGANVELVLGHPIAIIKVKRVRSFVQICRGSKIARASMDLAISHHTPSQPHPHKKAASLYLWPPL
ncbi:hypothetical protein RND71_009682 [Anisodus tanguticus]|uniref:Uncharacterized protein n=1 Tax=Anisodus tanguticus TaxID=243964 RepID=A0AAE1VIE6_9SOLA|nr:hypothetical protein RND71_009682 [Anisodus tanguticus]